MKFATWAACRHIRRQSLIKSLEAVTDMNLLEQTVIGNVFTPLLSCDDWEGVTLHHQNIPVQSRGRTGETGVVWAGNFILPNIQRQY